MDEIGTYPFRAVWEAVEPAIKGDFGYRCVPYFSWTGGESSKADAAFNFTLNPKASNLLEFETEGKPTARILFADFRKETKIEIPFSTFLSNNNIVYDENNYDIQTLKIKVSDIEAARALTAKSLKIRRRTKMQLHGLNTNLTILFVLKIFLLNPIHQVLNLNTSINKENI